MIEQSGKRDLSDHTTASTDIDKKEVTSELTMTDVDRRLAAFGVVRKPQSLDKLKEQIARKKAMEASKTPELKDRDMRRIQSEESKEQMHNERSRDDKMGRKMDKKSYTAEDLMKEKDEGNKSKEKEEKKKTIDGREKIEKGMANVRKRKWKRKVNQEKRMSGKEITIQKGKLIKRKRNENKRKSGGHSSGVRKKNVKKGARQERKIISGSAQKLEKDEERLDQKKKTRDTNDMAEKGANPTGKDKGVEVINIKEKESKEQKVKDVGGSKKLEEETSAKEIHVNKNSECQNEEKGKAIKAKSKESANNKTKSSEDAAHKERQSKQASGSVIHSTATSTLTLK
ncbi:hypothetical protein ANCCAN_09785 [Ancylostoma caninum]|uniref:Uncharacterized protein n=1 Tax=Ancylostoma caninum TaxID=29170 RepID=A0A368GIL1_ANCCA|nr:hypothetical protein ANCCAN_09785 [Ancylostoma caninum]